MLVVQKNHLKSSVVDFEIFKWLSHKIKNLYNYALYLIKTHYERTKQFLSLKKIFHIIKTHITYTQLHSDHAQLTLRLLQANYSSYFELLKLKKQGLYDEEVRPPSFLAKDGYFISQFIPRQMKRVDNQLRLSLGKRGKLSMGKRYLWVTIPPNIRDQEFKMIRIIPRLKGDYFEIEFVYDKTIEKPKLDLNHYLSLDLGLDNFAAAISTKETAFIIEGRGIKSYNCWWNKERSKLQSQYDKQDIKWGSRMSGLNIDRYNVMRNFIAHTVHSIVSHCINNEIGNLVIGDWGDMKRGLKIQKKTSQQFQHIPFARFKKKLISKCELYGIKTHLTEESYTSQTCSACGIIRKANRIKRGLYRCKSCGMQLNADINGAINIMRKVAPNSLSKWSSGDIISPERLRLVNFSV